MVTFVYHLLVKISSFIWREVMSRQSSFLIKRKHGGTLRSLTADLGIRPRRFLCFIKICQIDEGEVTESFAAILKAGYSLRYQEEGSLPGQSCVI